MTFCWEAGSCALFPRVRVFGVKANWHCCTRSDPPWSIPFLFVPAARVVKVTAMARETDPKKRVVITGMGICSVFGNDYNVYYDKLLEGTSGRATKEDRS